jgi:hypothetical protein
MPTRIEWIRFFSYCAIGVLMANENIRTAPFWFITVLIMCIDLMETACDSGDVETYSENPSC